MAPEVLEHQPFSPRAFLAGAVVEGRRLPLDLFRIERHRGPAREVVPGGDRRARDERQQLHRLLVAEAALQPLHQGLHLGPPRKALRDQPLQARGDAAGDEEIGER